MEHSENRRKRRGIPLWLMFILIAVILIMTIAILFLVLLRLDVIRCVPSDPKTPVAQTSPAVSPNDPTEHPANIPTPEPSVIETPEPAVSETPTEQAADTAVTGSRRTETQT